MIVLAVGMQKAGSTWHFNLTNDLLIAAGHQDMWAIRQKYRLHSLIRYNAIGKAKYKYMLPLILLPHFLGNTFAVKTHSGPNSRKLRFLLATGVTKVTYIYRDPRDVLISALDHGRKLRREGRTDSFARFDTFESVLGLVQKQLANWEQWMENGLALPIRYEDLLIDPVHELSRQVEFLELEVSAGVLPQIVATYRPENLSGADLHFNKGVAGRFRAVMSPKELDLCQKHFGDYLKKMGYPE